MQGILAEGVMESSWAAVQERGIQNVNDMAPLDTSEGAWSVGGSFWVQAIGWRKATDVTEEDS